MKRKKTFLQDKRLFALCAIIFSIALIIILRLFFLQIIYGKKYQEKAEGRHSINTDLKAERGKIFVKEYGSSKLIPVATNKMMYLVFVEPSKIQNKTKVAEVLSSTLHLDKEEITKILFMNDPYEPIAHYISEDIVEKLKSYSLRGIGFEEEPKRFYPEQGFGGHLLGFLGYNETHQSGKYGLEGYFDKELSGRAGFVSGKKDVFGRLIPWGDNILEKEEKGSDLVLTIDRGAQFFVCLKIKESVEKFEADMGSIIVMEPKSGKILAMCSWPDYKPNYYNKVKDVNIFINPALSNQYEPGSVFKPFTMAAAIDQKLVSPESTYEDEGEVYIEPHTIRNSDLKSNGVQTMTQVLEKSLNTGVIYAVRLLGPKKFRSYVESFGFGNLTGLELSGEAIGDISSLKKRGEIWSATASYGQGISATPIQILNAFNTLVNGGALMKPYIVEKIINADGDEKIIEPKKIKQVVSERTSILMRGMLASVVENGHAKTAQVKGYFIGGKTGTAQVSKKAGGGYEEGKKIVTFVGVAPADKPRFTILVRLDNPEAVEWASSSAAPVFSEIAKYLLQYYGVPAER